MALLQVLLLFFSLTLLTVPRSVSGEHEHNITALSARCDRAVSRHARQILQQYVFKHMHGKQRVDQLPASCPLAPLNDILLEHEQHKARKNKAQHRCTYCQKVFKNEFYLDQHLQRKHVDTIPHTATSCLAEVCDVLQCDWFSLHHQLQTSRMSKKKREEKARAAGAHCMPQAATRTRQLCEEVGNKCFPVQAHTGSQRDLKDPGDHKWDSIHEYWMHYFCAASTCNIDQKNELMLAVVDASTSYSRTIGIAVLLIVVLAMFYAGLYVWWSASSSAANDPSGKSKRVQPRPALTKPAGRGYINPPGTGAQPPGYGYSQHEQAVGQSGLGAAYATGQGQVMHSAHAQHAGAMHQRGQVGYGGMPPPPPPPPSGGFTGDQLYHHKTTPSKPKPPAAPGLGLWGQQAQAQQPPVKAD